MKHLFPIYKQAKYLEIVKDICDGKLVSGKNRISYYNVPASFDIETTSFIDTNGEKTAIMYEWSFSVSNFVIVGRTWEQYSNFLNHLISQLKIDYNRRLIIYVHNLSYEFQFIRKRFKWNRVFAIKERTPIYALDVRGLMYKCSYILSGYSLAKVGENLQKHKVRKLVGDLDYSKMRHSNTHLTVRELAYCVNDVLVVCAYIQEEIENCGNITKIPLTQTGYVRNYVKNKVTYDVKPNGNKFLSTYAKKVSALSLTPLEYTMCKMAFQGGYTHASHNKVGKVLYGVTSYDFTSSYPAVMLTERFPMSNGIPVKITNMEQLETYLNYFCTLLDITFYELDVNPKYAYEHYLSSSRCIEREDVMEENGRVYYAKKVRTVITNLDFKIIRKTYKWSRMEINVAIAYYMDYLPREFMECIVHFYKSKNTLKHVRGKEVEYMKSKQMLNSLYGMCVTDIIKDVFCYDTKWGVEHTTLEEGIERYNNQFGRFLYYPWGIFVTAYARYNLWNGILSVGEDYIYSDTDSIKILNGDSHTDYINQYNAIVKKKLEMAFSHRGLDVSDVEIGGRVIGTWDYDGHYSRFKTLGAKRYLLESDGELSITVAGLGKKSGVNYLLETYGIDGAFDAFSNRLYIPKGKSGKNTHTYIDDTREGILVDYNGEPNEYLELSALHLTASDFTLNMTQNYIDYLFLGKDVGHDFYREWR